MAHFTEAYLGTWPLSKSEAESELLIQTVLLLNVILKLINNPWRKTQRNSLL